MYSFKDSDFIVSKPRFVQAARTFYPISQEGHKGVVKGVGVF